MDMKREKGLDFVRAISVLGIVAFHFYVHSSSEQKLFLIHTNGAWGGTLNYLFFTLSGLVLHTKYGPQEKLDLRTFYYKRWKATMPAYLLVFCAAFLIQVIKRGQFFYLPIPKYRLLFTLIGMDCYINMVMPTYFLTGEWFLGAILLLYIIYPLLRFLTHKCRLITLAGSIALYVLFLKIDFFGMPINVNPATCILSFYIGMLLASYPNVLKNPVVVLLSALCCAVLIREPIGAPHITKEILVGATLLITLNIVGGFLCRSRLVNHLVSTVCRLGYYTFLIHHQLINAVLKHFNPVNTGRALLLLIALFFASLFFSYLLDMVIKRLFRSPLYLKFENAVLGKN